MRLLTTDELLVVSGGYINGEHDPRLDSAGGSGSATSTAMFICDQMSSDRKRDECLQRTANTVNCPGGWTQTDPSWEASGKGIKRNSAVFECKTDSSGSDDSNSCSSGSSDNGGSDSGKED